MSLPVRWDRPRVPSAVEIRTYGDSLTHREMLSHAAARHGGGTVTCQNYSRADSVLLAWMFLLTPSA